MVSNQCFYQMTLMGPLFAKLGNHAKFYGAWSRGYENVISHFQQLIYGKQVGHQCVVQIYHCHSRKAVNAQKFQKYWNSWVRVRKFALAQNEMYAIADAKLGNHGILKWNNDDMVSFSFLSCFYFEYRIFKSILWLSSLNIGKLL